MGNKQKTEELPCCRQYALLLQLVVARVLGYIVRPKASLKVLPIDTPVPRFLPNGLQSLVVANFSRGFFV